jgi:hypothetical protein
MCLFFATRTDLEPGLRRIEAQYELKYVPVKFYPSCDIAVYSSAIDIPEFGKTPSTHVSIPQYLVFFPGTEINITELPNTKINRPFLIKHDDNPHALSFAPGGEYIGDKLSGRILIGGAVAVHNNISSEMLTLYQIYHREITRKFRAVKHHVERETWRVGPEAYEWLKQGARLITENPSFSPEWDLRLPHETQSK